MLIRTLHQPTPPFWQNSEPPALGNLHRVVVADPAVHPPDTGDDRPVDVYIHTTARGTDIRCFEQGRAIQFCGSGVIAAVALLARNGDLPRQLRHGNRTLTPLVHGALYGFALSVPPWQPTQAAALWLHLARLDAGQVRVQRGYALVEAQHESLIGYAQPRLHLLALTSAKALIMTAPGASSRGPGHYVMRYFAPQYGKPEDAATGSANALLMRYWAARLRKSELAGRQLSATGGACWGECKGARVSLWGHAEAL